LRSFVPDGDWQPTGLLKALPTSPWKWFRPPIRPDQRISDYFAAGCQRVWVAYPGDREVYIHGLARVTRRRADEYLEDAELLPGFSVKVSSLFE